MTRAVRPVAIFGGNRIPFARSNSHYEQASRDFSLTREAVLGSALDPRTPAYGVQQACGTGLETAMLIGNKIAFGQVDVGIADLDLILSIGGSASCIALKEEPGGT